LWAKTGDDDTAGVVLKGCLKIVAVDKKKRWLFYRFLLAVDQTSIQWGSLTCNLVLDELLVVGNAGVATRPLSSFGMCGSDGSTILEIRQCL
jgi:hypothetical protein